MFKANKYVAALLLFVGILQTLDVGADSFITAADSRKARELDRELYHEDRVVRYRIVVIDEPELRRQLYVIANSAADEIPPAIIFTLFNDVVLSTSSFDRVTEVDAKFLLVPSDNYCENSKQYAGHLLISKVGHVRAGFEICNELYGIEHTSELPYHVVMQIDPKRLRSID